jgi:hypothetical protein
MADDQLLNDVREALRSAGMALKNDIWRPEDEPFLTARATDLVGLHAKAAAADNESKRKAYLAAAADTVNHVKLFALMRMEVGAQHVLDALGRFFLEKVVPALIAVLPKLVGML